MQTDIDGLAAEVEALNMEMESMHAELRSVEARRAGARKDAHDARLDVKVLLSVLKQLARDMEHLRPPPTPASHGEAVPNSSPSASSLSSEATAAASSAGKPAVFLSSADAAALDDEIAERMSRLQSLANCP